MIVLHGCILGSSEKQLSLICDAIGPSKPLSSPPPFNLHIKHPRHPPSLHLQSHVFGKESEKRKGEQAETEKEGESGKSLPKAGGSKKQAVSVDETTDLNVLSHLSYSLSPSFSDWLRYQLSSVEYASIDRSIDRSSKKTSKQASLLAPPALISLSLITHTHTHNTLIRTVPLHCTVLDNPNPNPNPSPTESPDST